MIAGRAIDLRARAVAWVKADPPAPSSPRFSSSRVSHGRDYTVSDERDSRLT